MIVLAARLVPVVIPTGALPPIFLLMSEGGSSVHPAQATDSGHFAAWRGPAAGTCRHPAAAARRNHPRARPCCHGIAEAITISGFVLQLSAKLTLRRSFGVVAANRGVKASGPYRLVRHPMYAGYALTHVGFLLAGPNLGTSPSTARPSPSRCGESSPRSASCVWIQPISRLRTRVHSACCLSSSERRRP